jgi:UDP-N-acetylglucosamine:LPS N-acetylglucosamine transferase
MFLKVGGAVQFTQKELTGKKLSKTILQLMNNEEKLAEMGAAMKCLSFPDAAQRIVACCLEEIDKSRA